MKKCLLIILFTACFASCSLYAASNTPNTRFDAFKERFVLAILKLYPDEATGKGYHAYDSVLNVWDNNYRKVQVDFSNNYLDSLNTFNYAALNDINKTDYAIIKNELQTIAWQVQSLKEYTWDPSEYNIASVFAYILNEPYDKLDNRLQNLYKKMQFIPAYYIAAKANIYQPVKS